MKILVTGANGYIGLHIVKTLLDKGIQVIACDLNTDEVDKRAERKNIDLFTLPDTNIYTFIIRNPGRMSTSGLAQWIRTQCLNSPGRSISPLPIPYSNNR